MVHCRTFHSSVWSPEERGRDAEGVGQIMLGLVGLSRGAGFHLKHNRKLLKGFRQNMICSVFFKTPLTAVQRMHCSVVRTEVGRPVQPVAEEDLGKVDGGLNLGGKSGDGGELEA